MSVFKAAFSRGVAEKLAQAGLVKFASVEEAENIADAAGAAMDHEPVTDGIPSKEKVASLIMAIVEASEKTAGGTGSLITGGKGEQANTPAQAAMASATAALDLKNRDVNAYAKGVRGVGHTDMKIPSSAVVGKEEAHPKAPATTDSRPNTVNVKAGNDLSEMIRKIATGATGNLITGDNKAQENTPEQAAQDSSTAALDQKARPQGEYAKGEKGVGNTDLPTNQAGVGKEEDHPKKPGTTDSAPNSVVEAKTSAFMELFQETANKYVSKLASLKSDDEKVAAVKKLMVMDDAEAASFLAKGQA